MKKLFISVLFIGGFAAYAFYNYSQTQAASANQSASAAVTAPVTTSNSSNSASAAAVSNTTSSASAPPLTASQTTTTVTKSTTTATPVTTVTTSSGQYTDGTYTGSVEDAYYGNVQVEAVISGGRLSNVVFLQSPNDRGTSISINKSAMPILISEAVKAQSANVNGVSGASDTSTAFEQSLASALSAAKA